MKIPIHASQIALSGIRRIEANRHVRLSARVTISRRTEQIFSFEERSLNNTFNLRKQRPVKATAARSRDISQLNLPMD